MTLAKWTKVTLVVGLLLGLVVTVAVGKIALDHDPQGEFSSDSVHYLTLLVVVFVEVNALFALVASAIEIGVRVVRWRRHGRS